MSARRRVRRASGNRTISCGPGELEPGEWVVPAPAAAPARVVALQGGSRWLVTVVARLLSEDVVDGTEAARLILRFECLSDPFRAERVTTANAWSLDEMPDEALRALASVPAARYRGAND
ncbi:MAG: hypothetical protein ACREON_04315 [Gemmatimonadaceae bacterium]